MYPLKSAVSPWIYTVLQEQFGKLFADKMAQALIEADLPSQPAALCDRIHIAIIKQADGDPKKFLMSLKIAKTDWRKILISSNMAGSQWRQKLSQEGIQPPLVS